MSHNLTDIHTSIKKALESGEQLHYSLEPCLYEDSIFGEPITIVPLWLEKKQKAEAEARLQAERQRRGTGVPVDLGLSVLWSSRNVGAPSGEQPGLYVGWGDITASKNSLNYDEYPSACPPEQISGTDFDIARVMWAETWRIPTIKEMSELMQQCQWIWTVIKGVPGFQVIGKTGQSIFLPAGGDRYAMQYEDAYYSGRYWTADLFPEETARAYYLEFNQQTAQINSMARYMGMLIRPVLEKEDNL